MVMADRPDVRTAPFPITVVDVVGLAQQLGNALVRVPFRRPWEGASGPAQNVGAAVTRETIRSFMGYASSLRVPEWRSLEQVIDELCKMVMRPVVMAEGVDHEEATLGGVPGIWYRPRGVEPLGTILYLHGGGYIGTSPTMYAFFTAHLARVTGCEVFVADYRLAPEFPFPAGLDDAVAVVEALLADGVAPERLLVAGDSGGGGLAGSLMYRDESDHLPRLAGLILFSPEADLTLDQPSIADNARFDILPWNIPTAAYLHGTDPASGVVSSIDQDVDRWPPTFVAFGGAEMFRDAIRELADHLEAAEVPVVVVEEPAMFHVFPILMPWADASRRVIAEVGAFVHARFAADVPAAALPSSDGGRGSRGAARAAGSDRA